MTNETSPRWSVAFAIGLVLLIAMLALIAEQSRGIRPKGLNAPAAEFSAARAHRILAEVIGDEPHPVGTAANGAVRDRIVAHFRALGYDPVIDARWECHGWADCAEVQNIVARLEGNGGRDTLLLSAHYDSVGAGPGASDDGAGVAALLEIARILKGESLRNPVIFLIDDGEEAGLIGAAAFVNQHPLARDVRTVINLEARGSSGASYMFETSRDNRGIIDVLARNLRRPATSSLYSSIYEQLPNDTDFTVFKAAGYAGVNFAYLRDVQHYHTPLDDVSNASVHSIQHHGENALAMARALADGGAPQTRGGNAVFFDVFSLGVVRWPESWTIVLVLLNVVLLVAALILARRRGTTMVAMLWGSGFAVTSLLIAALIAAAGMFALRLSGDTQPNWVASPGALLIFYWTAGLLAAVVAAILFRRRATPEGLWSGAAIVWTLLATIAPLLLSGAAFLLLVPSLVMNVCGLARRAGAVAYVLPAVVAAVTLFPAAWPLYAGMGLGIMPLVSILVACAVLPLAAMVGPMPPRHPAVIAGALLVVTMTSLITAAMLDPYSSTHPRRMTVLLHHDADTSSTRWLIPGDEGALPASMRQAAAWEADRANPFPWFSVRGYFAAPAPSTPLPLPGVAVTHREPGLIRLRVTPSGEPSKVALMLRGGEVESVEVNGRKTTTGSSRRISRSGSWLRVTLHTVPEQAEIAIATRGEVAPEAVIEQRWYGLPPFAEPITAARGSTAVPSQEGDVTVVTQRLELGGAGSVAGESLPGS